MLFTYRPRADDATLMAPGPVFIHAEHCEAWDGEGFPQGLPSLPLAFEERAGESRVAGLTRASGVEAERHIASGFGSADTGWMHLRHAEAGCFIARVDRA